MWYCLFDGSIRATASSPDDICLGAFVGWSANDVTERYCVEKGTYLGIGDDYSKVAFNWQIAENTDDQSNSSALPASHRQTTRTASS